MPCCKKDSSDHGARLAHAWEDVAAFAVRQCEVADITSLEPHFCNLSTSVVDKVRSNQTIGKTIGKPNSTCRRRAQPFTCRVDGGDTSGPQFTLFDGQLTRGLRRSAARSMRPRMPYRRRRTVDAITLNRACDFAIPQAFGLKWHPPWPASTRRPAPARPASVGGVVSASCRRCFSILSEWRENVGRNRRSP